MVRALGSHDVLVNGRPWSRQGDVNSPHLLPALVCPTHVAPIALGSFTVRVNGRGAGRIGDKLISCTAVAGGSHDVLAG
jgi:uncharacterized Zn-binding protein involved in type VI secretion